MYDCVKIYLKRESGSNRKPIISTHLHSPCPLKCSNKITPRHQVVDYLVNTCVYNVNKYVIYSFDHVIFPLPP